MTASFVATRKTALLYRRPWPTEGGSQGAIFEYIGRLYNPRRRYSALGYLTPAEYNMSMMPTAIATGLSTVHQTGESPLHVGSSQ